MKRSNHTGHMYDDEYQLVLSLVIQTVLEETYRLEPIGDELETEIALDELFAEEYSNDTVLRSEYNEVIEKLWEHYELLHKLMEIGIRIPYVPVSKFMYHQFTAVNQCNKFLTLL